MKSKLVLANGYSLDLDEFATDQVLKNVHKNELSNSLIVMHIADKTGRLKYSVPMNSILFIDYFE